MIIGGGIAGLSCACKLADKGIRVTVLEARSRLGGRAFSFVEKDTGLLLDNCQHVLLGCCEAAIKFLTRIGSISLVGFPESINLIGKNNERLILKPSSLPPPLHLLPTFLETRYISLKDKLLLGKVMKGIIEQPPKYGQNAKAYLKMLGSSETLLEKIFEPVITAALNEGIDEASAQYTQMVLKKSLAGGRTDYKLGVPRAPISKILEEPTLIYLAEHDCEARLNTHVERFHFDGNKIKAIELNTGEIAEYDLFISAVPPWSLSSMGYETEAAILMQWRPIISAHMFLEEEIHDFERAAVVGEPFQWVFNKSRDFGLEIPYVQAVASAADEIAGLSKEQLTKHAKAALIKASGKAGIKLKKAIIMRENRATFSTSGNGETARPASKTQYKNLFLAGDWINTLWPSTIESAVLSGETAADLALSVLK